MSSRALSFPAYSVSHLSAAEAACHPELEALARLEEGGFVLGLVALPAVIEDSFYRLNNLPPRLARLYTGLDPLDPDEDVLEEAEPAAMRLVGESYLLDDLIDAIYASLSPFTGDVVVRRAGQAGERVESGRAALLAVKRAFKADWTVDSVLDRLAVEGRLGVEARPLLVHPPDLRAPASLDQAAAAVLGRAVSLSVAQGDGRALTRVSAAPSA